MSGKLDDPQWRVERAHKAGRAGAAATKKVWHDAKIADAVDAVDAAAPELRPDQIRFRGCVPCSPQLSKRCTPSPERRCKPHETQRAAGGKSSDRNRAAIQNKSSRRPLLSEERLLAPRTAVRITITTDMLDRGGMLASYALRQIERALWHVPERCPITLDLGSLSQVDWILAHRPAALECAPGLTIVSQDWRVALGTVNEISNRLTEALT
jgi:hypothetical protein